MISVFCKKAFLSPSVMVTLRPNNALSDARHLLRQSCWTRPRTWCFLSKLRTSARSRLVPLIRSAIKSPAKFVFCSALGYHKDGLRHVLYHPPRPQNSISAALTEELLQLGVIQRVAQFLWQVFEVLKILFRTAQMCLFITPLVISAPLALKFEGFQERWFRLLVATIETCGPVYVKLGQWASTR